MTTLPLKVMVIGARGQVGSEICALARLRKYTVVEAGRGTSVIPEISNNPYVIEQCIREHAPNFVFNCAAEHRLLECEQKIQTAYMVNSFSQLDLVKHCATAGASLVYLSTDYVFPGVPGDEGEYRPSDPTRPVNVYGMTKQLGERIVLGYPKGYVARLSHVYGHAQSRTKGASMVDRMVSGLKNKAKIEINASETAISMTYAKDAARMLLGIMSLAPGIYHCVNKGSTTPRMVAEDICSLLNAPKSSVVDSELVPEGPAVPRPVNATLLPSVELDGLNRPILDALREYLADCGHCPY